MHDTVGNESKGRQRTGLRNDWIRATFSNIACFRYLTIGIQTLMDIDIDAEDEWTVFLERAGPMLVLMEDPSLGLNETSAAHRLGVYDRLGLAAWLQSRRLPSFRLLRNWYYVVRFVEMHNEGMSLGSFSLNRADAPSVLYRFVKCSTRLTWQEMRTIPVEQLKRHALQIWQAESDAIIAHIKS